MNARAQQDLQAVKDYLEASMTPDPVRAARYVDAAFVCRFTGNRVFDTPAGPTSASRPSGQAGQASTRATASALLGETAKSSRA